MLQLNVTKHYPDSHLSVIFILDFIQSNSTPKTNSLVFKEMINCLKKGEITEDYALSLKEHLRDKGLKFFGGIDLQDFMRGHD